MNIFNHINDGKLGLVARPVVGSRLRVLLNVLKNDELELRMAKVLAKSEIFVNEHSLIASELERYESAIEVKLMRFKNCERLDE